MKLTLFVLSTLILCLTTISCSSKQQWYKPGATKAMYERDKSACEDQLLETPTTGYQGTMYSFESCMEGKGYTALDHKAM